LNNIFNAVWQNLKEVIMDLEPVKDDGSKIYLRQGVQKVVGNIEHLKVFAIPHTIGDVRYGIVHNVKPCKTRKISYRIRYFCKLGISL
jgi:hypothetical protein